jgi:hypothetical protein
VHCFEVAVLVLVLLQWAPLWVLSLFALALASVIPMTLGQVIRVGGQRCMWVAAVAVLLQAVIADQSLGAEQVLLLMGCLHS